MTPILLHLAEAVLLFLALNAAYWVVFKSRSGKGPLQTLLPRVRVWAYVLVFGIAARFFVAGLPERWQSVLPKILEGALLVAASAMLVELTAGLIFEFLLPARRNVRLPYMIQSLARGVAYLAVALMLLSLWNVDISSLLAGSAIFSVVVGLALQETLGNLFSGLSVDVARPFRLGDWVRIGAQEGRVQSLNWRATSLITREGTCVLVPNRDVAKDAVMNYSWPQALQRISIPVRVHYRHPPGEVEAVMLACALDTPGVCTEPAPEVQLAAFAADAIEYVLKLSISDYSRRPALESEVRRRLWYRFRRQGLDIPYAVGDIPWDREDRGQPLLADRLDLLCRIDFLGGLSEPERDRLAESVALLVFARGETVFRQGDSGSALYIIRQGQVEVRVADAAGRQVFCQPLGAGDFFGEISLMTGAPRSATIVAVTDVELLEVEKEDLKPLLEGNPELVAIISRALAERQHASSVSLAEQQASQARGPQSDIDSTAGQILAAVKRFFSY